MRDTVKLGLATIVLVWIPACSAPEFPPLPATAEGLVGTTWEFDGYEATFEDTSTVLVGGNGDPGSGIAGTFVVVEGGIIEVTIGNRTRAGLWDGQTLVVDGIVAVRKR